MRKMMLTAAVLSMTGCVAHHDSSMGAHKTYNGARLYTAKCNTSPDACLEEAYITCKVADGGAYTEFYSDSHKGSSSYMDTTTGEVTWFNLQYQCTPTFGKQPKFAFRGAPAAIRANTKSKVVERINGDQ